MSDFPLFELAPILQVRIPMRSFEDYRDLLGHACWEEALLDLYGRDSLLQEAVLIASPSLYVMLKNKPTAAALSLLSYYIRMCTRATPFGLFSCVTMGQWSGSTSAKFDPQAVIKDARPDMEWLYNVIHHKYRDERQFPSLPLVLNPLVTKRSGRYHLDYVRHCEEGRICPKRFSIRGHALIKQILERCKRPIEAEKLWEELANVLPTLEREPTLGLMRALVEQQFLLPAILPSLLSRRTNASPVPFTSYNATKPGEGITTLEALNDQCQTYSKSAHLPIQVDSTYSAHPIQLNREVGAELQRSVELFWQISSGAQPSNRIADFRHRFVEKYGIGVRVPLKEALAPDRGVGPYLSGKKTDATAFGNQWRRWLKEQWQSCMISGCQEVVLSTSIVNQLYRLSRQPQPRKEAALPSFEVLFELCANSQQAIDRGEFLIRLGDYRWGGGAASGRFLHLFSDQVRTSFADLYRKEEELVPDSIFVEVSYWPSAVRYGNVATQPCLRAYRLDIEDKDYPAGGLSLDDIYIQASNEGMQLLLAEGDRQIIPCFGNFLNPDFAPEPLMLMRDIGVQRWQHIYPFCWDDIVPDAIYQPRIRYGRTLLAAASWSLDASSYEHLPYKTAIDRFEAWAEQWHLPQRILLIIADHRLLLDRSHSGCLEILYRKLKQGKTLHFREQIASHWLKSDRGHHSPEMVATFIRGNAAPAPMLSIRSKKRLQVGSLDRLKLPGSEWLYVKLYLLAEGENRFILNYLASLADSLHPSGWFFVRYQDPEGHLRFRLCFASPEEAIKALPLLQETLHGWLDEGLIKRVEFSGYEREIERYGGLQLIEFAEEVFHRDTLVVIDTLAQRHREPPAVLGALSVLEFLRDAGLESKEILDFLHPAARRRSALAGFRNHKAYLQAQLQEGQYLAAEPLLTARKEAFSRLRGHLPEKEAMEILSCLLHIHCNRLGCDRTQEDSAYAYAYRTVISQQHKAEQALLN